VQPLASRAVISVAAGDSQVRVGASAIKLQTGGVFGRLAVGAGLTPAPPSTQLMNSW
jgi:hypothetical protein